jgi:hypothetical protein
VKAIVVAKAAAEVSTSIKKKAKEATTATVIIMISAHIALAVSPCRAITQYIPA